MRLISISDRQLQSFLDSPLPFCSAYLPTERRLADAERAADLPESIEFVGLRAVEKAGARERLHFTCR